MFQSDCSVFTAQEVESRTCGKLSTADVTSALIREVCLLQPIQCRKDKRASPADCVYCLVTVRVTDTPLYSVNALDPLPCIHTHTGPIVSKAPLNMDKEGDVTICPSSLGINVRYRSVLESIGSHYLSSVTYLSCYGCDCFQSPGPAVCRSRVILYRTGETDVWRVLIKTYPL